MAGVSQFNHFPCNTFSPSPPMVPVCSKATILTIGLTERSSWSAGRSKDSSGGAMKRSVVLRVRAAGSDYVSGTDTGGAGARIIEADKPEEPSEIARLKKALVDSFYGTNRGLSASAETRAEIMELITQLDARNPTPAPTEALTLLNGKWILAHTSSLGLFPVLSSGMLPLVNVEEISQIIDSVNFSIQNSIKFSGPLGSTSINANAKFEIQSPQRVQVKFEELIIGTPQVADSLGLPESVEFLGQQINLAQFRGVLAPVRDTARTISSRPPLKLSLPSTTGAESWLLTTYLDEELRISWGDVGNVFVFLKENSLLLSP